MKIVKLKGGMGNQMFQYAFAKRLEEVTGDTVKIDYSLLLSSANDRIRKPRIKKFDISIPDATTDDCKKVLKLRHHGPGHRIGYKLGLIAEKAINNNYYFEMNRDYIPIERISKYDYFDGYWQSWRYPDPIIDELRKDFTPISLTSCTNLFIQDVQSVNSVFVGIRRGDYSKLSKRYGFFGVDYFIAAMEYIESKIKNPTYFVFSDDIEWVMKNYNFGKRDVIFRTDNLVIDDFDEFLIMSSCKHSIIINSTYHWWAAKLNDNGDKIIVAPKRWFFDKEKIDIIPPHWKTL